MAYRSSGSLVLEYSKRRYDGGPEKDMIEQIELQYDLLEQQKRSVRDELPTSPIEALADGASSDAAPSPEATAEVPAAPESRVKRIWQALVTPCLELLLSVIGMVISTFLCDLMIQHKQLDAVVVNDERTKLKHQSWIMLQKSLNSLLRSPWVVFQTCLP